MTLEKFRDWVWEEKAMTGDVLVERLHELTPFEQGQYVGEIMGYQCVLDQLRNILKYEIIE